MGSMTDRYYQKRLQKSHSKILETAITHNSSASLVAVDCGCGVGNDARYLVEQGYTVHAFDNDARAIEQCRTVSVSGVAKDALHLYRASFEDFPFPKAGFIVANSALFFCLEQYFDSVWQRIEHALEPGGVFCGDFLGVEDATNHPRNPNPTKFLTQVQLQQMLGNFNVIGIKERKGLQPTMTGREKYWHAFTVIAQKR